MQCGSAWKCLLLSNGKLELLTAIMPYQGFSSFVFYDSVFRIIEKNRNYFKKSVILQSASKHNYATKADRFSLTVLQMLSDRTVSEVL